jgi:hypothetical protein
VKTVAGLNMRQLGELKAWLEPFFGSSRGNRGHGATTVAVVQIPVFLDSPDGSSNAFAAFFSDFGITAANIGRHIAPAFPASVDGTWEGLIRVPKNYASGGKLILSWFCNATSGNLRHRVSSKNVANGSTYNVTYTDESYVNQAVPGTALQRLDVTFTLSPVLSPEDDLYLKVTRNGSSGSDTLAAVAVLAKCMFEYTSG